MKSPIVAASLAVILNSAVMSAALASHFDLRQNVDFSTWVLLGDAGVTNTSIPNVGTDSVLRLTSPGTGDQVGGAYAPEPLLIDFNSPFTISFRFFIAHGSVLQGDGFTFFMTGNDLPTLGSGGSDLGYGGSFNNGFAFAVDTFNFDDEPEAVSVQILGDGDVTPMAFTLTGLADIQPADFFQWFGTVGFTPSGLDDETGDLYFEIHQAFSNQTFRVELLGADWFGIAQDIFDDDSNFLGRGVYIGFTAANGLADDGHFIGSLTQASVPEPEAWTLLLGGLGLVGWRLRRQNA